MQPSSLVLLVVFVTVLLVTVFEVASAKKQVRPGGQMDPVSPATNVAEGVGFTFKAAPRQIDECSSFLSRQMHCELTPARSGGRIREHYLWPKNTKEIEAAYLEMLGRAPDTTSNTVGDEISA
jgi:hypothetical protein